MKHILTTLLLATAFVACKKQKNEIKPVPTDIIKYFAYYHDNSSWQYIDTLNKTANTITIHTARVGEMVDSREQTFRAEGTGLVDEKSFVYNIGPNTVDLHSADAITESYMLLRYNNGNFYSDDGSTKIEIIPEMQVYMHKYTNVLHYHNPLGAIPDMWFAPYKGLIQYRKANKTYMVKSINAM